MADIVGRLGRRPPIFRALGFSQGAATVCRWLAARRIVPDQLILWGGTVPGDLPHADARALAGGAPVVVVVGHDDEFVPAPILAEAERRLGAAGIPYRLMRFAGGHRLNGDLLRRIADAPLGG
ncbi:MAG: hypothetical protein NVS9B3_10620 [Gemmatimonadaceae bacterium]